MPLFSRIPLIGLANLAKVIRKTPGDDGAGGIDDEGAEVTVLAEYQCRITTLSTDDDELDGHGFSSGLNWKVIGEYAPSIARLDFLRLTHGQFPHNASPIGAPPDSAETYTLTHPLGTASLVWDVATGGWKNSGGTIDLTWVATEWVFTDTVNSNSWTPAPSPAQLHKIWVHPSAPWNGGIPGYSVVAGDPNRDYRVVWRKDQQDDFGDMHHTALVIEYEEGDT